jgi:mono/diheme cytochrome c family protein
MPAVRFSWTFPLVLPLLILVRTGGFVMKRIGMVFVLTALGLAWSQASAVAQSQAKADQGAALFVSQKCTMCHSAAGKGNPKGSLDRVAATHKADEIRQWILDPEAMRGKTNATRTPAMKPIKLSADQVDALVAFITSLKPTPAAADAEK